MDWRCLHQVARAQVESVLEDLPPSLAEPARALPVIYLPRPDRSPDCHGLEPDTLGLFAGPAMADSEWVPGELEARIYLFLENLWEYADANEDIYRHEVRQTYLHELGHYLGLDEDDLEDRGL